MSLNAATSSRHGSGPASHPTRSLLDALALEEASTEAADAYFAWHEERIRRTVALARKYASPRDAVLDVGASPLTPRVISLLAPSPVTVLDPSERWRDAVQEAGGSLVVGSLTDPSLPFPAESFGAAIVAEVFEHLTECPAHIVPRIARILRPDGVLIVTTPNQARWLNRLRLMLGVNIQELPEHLFHKVWLGYGHVREFTVREYPGEFAVGGLETVTVGGWSPHPMPRGDAFRRWIDRFGPASLDQVLYGVFRKSPSTRPPS